MPKFNKPTPSKINTIWATNAVTGDITEIDTSKIQQGWIQEKPPYESENWINQQHDQYIAYINQLGFPEWDQYTEYQAGKSYVQGSNDTVYKCIQTHVNKNPATAGNESFWNVWEGNRQATTSSRGTTQYATDPQTRNGLLNNVAVTPANLLGGLLGSVSLGSNGEIKIPVNNSGTRLDIIVKWGVVTHGNIGNETILSVSYPTPFPTATQQIILGSSSGSNITVGNTEGAEVVEGSITKSGFDIASRWQSRDSSQVFRYLAIGY